MLVVVEEEVQLLVVDMEDIHHSMVKKVMVEVEEVMGAGVEEVVEELVLVIILVQVLLGVMDIMVVEQIVINTKEAVEVVQVVQVDLVVVDNLVGEEMEQLFQQQV